MAIIKKAQRTYKAITEYVNPVMVNAMYDDKGALTAEAKQILETIQIDGKNGTTLLTGLSGEKYAIKQPIIDPDIMDMDFDENSNNSSSFVQLDNTQNNEQNQEQPPVQQEQKADISVLQQQQDIQNVGADVLNFLLQQIQSTVVTGKQFINWVAKKTFSKDDDAKIFDYTDGQKLELIRKELVSKKLPMESLANLFEVQENKFVVKGDIQIPQMQIELDGKKLSLKDALNKIGEQLAKDVGQDKLQDLKDGKIPHWYDFGFVKENTEKYPKAVKMFRDVMQYITEWVVMASSFVKGIVNEAYSLYKEEQQLLPKNSAELLSDLTSEVKQDPLQWANLAQKANLEPQL